MAVDVAAAQEFIRTNHRAVLATFRKDGRPALSPVIVALDDAGRVVVSTRETALKVKHLRRDPRVAISVFTDRFFGEFVQAEGIAEVVTLPEAMQPLVDYYRTVSGEHPDWDDYRAAMVRDQRVVVRFAIERAGPNVSG
jgi:PPOX class probable F420-dependent enzyme